VSEGLKKQRKLLKTSDEAQRKVSRERKIALATNRDLKIRAETE
jgi:hypothetical protein